MQPNNKHITIESHEREEDENGLYTEWDETEVLTHLNVVETYA
jgi:hypothetical protein